MQDTRSALDEVEEHEPIQSVDENTLGASPKNTTKQPVVDRLMTVHPALKYLGFSLLMVYHYLMWFCPSSFFKTDLFGCQRHGSMALESGRYGILHDRYRGLLGAQASSF